MDKTPNNSYLKTKVMTASPEQLQLMLYDGAIRFCEQARTAIEHKEIENSFKLLTKAQNIVMELCNSMKTEVAPDVCDNMRRLYLFCYERLVDANIKKAISPLDEAIQILHHMRETWLMLMEKINEEKTQQQSLASEPAPQPHLVEQAAPHVGAAINFEG